MTATAGLEIHCVDHLEELRPWQPQWNVLTDSVPESAPTCSYAWFASIIEAIIPSDTDWICIFVTQNGQLIAILPMLRYCPTGFSILKKPGFALLDDPLSYVSDFLIAAHLNPDTLDQLSIRLHSFLHRHILRAARAPEHGGISALFFKPNSGCLTVSRPIQRGAYIQTSGSFETYKSQLGWISRNVRRGRRRLQNRTGYEPIFLVEKQANEETLGQFIDLEAKGYKGRCGSAIKNSASRVRFYRALTTRLAEAGHLEWHLLRDGKRLIAAHFAFKNGASLVVSKICYDEDYGYCSPGSLLMDEVLRRAFADPAITRLDLITDLPWHARWNAKKQQYFAITVYPKHLLFVPGWALHRGLVLLRSVMTALRGRLETVSSTLRNRF